MSYYGSPTKSKPRQTNVPQTSAERLIRDAGKSAVEPIVREELKIEKLRREKLRRGASWPSD